MNVELAAPDDFITALPGWRERSTWTCAVTSTRIESLEIVEGSRVPILSVRGHRVMLDADLAALYGVETRILVRNVKRHIDRFPADFMFRLTDAEAEALRSQFGIIKTEQATAALAAMLYR